MLIEWKPAYETGVDFIDEDHQTLVQLINRLEDALAAGRNVEVPEMMARLATHFDQHCAREEAIMRKVGFAELEAHAKEHRQVKARIAELGHRLERDTSGPAVEAVIAYLDRWFFDHVIGKDLQLREAYRAKGVAKAPVRRGSLDRIDVTLARFKVRTRILMAVLIPTVLAIGVTIALIHSKYELVREMAQVEALTGQAVKVGDLVHELQKERGLTARVLSGDVGAANELDLQRGKVDQSRPAVAASTMGNTVQTLAEIERLRTAVGDKSMKTGEIIDGYSKVIAILLGGLGNVAQNLESAQVSNRLIAYLSLVQGKERAGQERAVGAAGFSASFPDWLYKRFVQRGAQEQAYFDFYLTFVDPAHRQDFSDAVSETAMAEFEGLRNTAVQNLARGTVDPKAWFAAATKRMEVLKTLENKAATDLQSFAAGIGTSAKRDLTVITTVMAVLIVLAMAVTAIIIRSVVRPFLDLAGTISRIGAGEKDAEVLGVERRDEIGDMARTIMVFRSVLLTNDAMQAEQAVEHAFHQTRIKRREELTSAFDQKVSEFVGVLASSSTELVATAHEMTRVARETTDRSTSVAAASEQTSANIQTVAAAVEQLSASVGEITRQVTQSAHISAEAVQEACGTDATVAGLAEAAQKIGHVVQIINGIAHQTNLLALNATIEAARAGEAGMGFAVVANEVKHLADQTVSATTEIVDQVKAIQDATAAAVTAIRHIGGTIREINGISTAIASAVEQQSAATGEIARNVQQAAHGVEDVNHNIVDVSHGASDTGAAATQVLQSANDVSNRSELIRAEVEGFLSEIRSA